MKTLRKIIHFLFGQTRAKMTLFLRKNRINWTHNLGLILRITIDWAQKAHPSNQIFPLHQAGLSTSRYQRWLLNKIFQDPHSANSRFLECELRLFMENLMGFQFSWIGFFSLDEISNENSHLWTLLFLNSFNPLYEIFVPLVFIINLTRFVTYIVGLVILFWGYFTNILFFLSSQLFLSNQSPVSLSTNN